MPRPLRSSWHRHCCTLFSAALLCALGCNFSRWNQRAPAAETPAAESPAADSPVAESPAARSSAVPSAQASAEDMVAATPGELLVPPLAPPAAAPPPDAGAEQRVLRALEAASGEPAFPPYAGHAEDGPAPAVPIEGLENLGYYFGKLTRTELGSKGAVARASLWGDSVIGGDGLTDELRQRSQKRFGDAGHGFHALGKYSRWYNHRGVRYQELRQWDTCLIIFKCEKDRRYGYGGVSSESLGQALSVWRTAQEGIGRRVSRFELWYQKRPDGGGFEIRVDGEVRRVVDSKAAQVSDAVETLRLADTEHQIEVAALGTGVARGYGVVMERETPGVVWDELSLIGSFIQRLDYEDPEHIKAQVRRRDVDLLAFMFGGNDLSREHSDLKTTTEPYEAEYTRVLRKFRLGKPQASCVILSMTDHARKVDDKIVSRPGVARLVAAQRKVALAEGCAFFDTYQAMGGPGAIEKGRASKPPLASPDLRHPTIAGQRRIASLFYAALMHGYASYRRSHVGAPLPPLGESSS